MELISITLGMFVITTYGIILFTNCLDKFKKGNFSVTGNQWGDYLLFTNSNIINHLVFTKFST